LVNYFKLTVGNAFDGFDSQLHSNNPPHGFEPGEKQLATAVYDRVNGDQMVTTRFCSIRQNSLGFRLDWQTKNCLESDIYLLNQGHNHYMSEKWD
jgi:hypothetical protein